MPRKPAHPGPVAEGRLSAAPSAQTALELETRTLARELIHPDPLQPRKHADAELEQDLRVRGQLDPITVRPHPEILGEFMIIDGERRWRSADGVLSSLRCQIREDMDSHAQRLAAQLSHNTGKPLEPLEEAAAFKELADETGMSVADLADFLGRPKSTVGERLALLELGPWLEWIQNGKLPLSHAVKVLLPLRTAAMSAHENALAVVAKDYRFTRNEAGGISLYDFANLVKQAYLPSMYPLTKTKSYGKQPELTPSVLAKHDSECDCGGILFDFGSDSPRRACGNPSWWRPLHRAALKAKKPKSGTVEKRTRTLYLPAGVKSVKSEYGQTPRNVVRLTDSDGEWARNSANEEFDPADLSIDEGKLVTWPSMGSTSYPCVGTTDVAAVKKAQKTWTDRFTAARETAVRAFGEAIKNTGVTYRIAGPGALHLAQLFDNESGAVVADVGAALGYEMPAAAIHGNKWDRARAAIKWFHAQPLEIVSRILTGLAAMQGEKLPLPTDVVAGQKEKAINAIRKRAIPWKTKPKVKAAPAKPSTRTAADSMKSMYPSPALAKVVGWQPLPRTDVMKKLWAYIKREELQDKKMIGADAILRPIFDGKLSVSVLGLAKLIDKQLAGTKEAAALIGTGKRSPKGALADLSEETAELPLDLPPKVRACVYCECTEDNACELENGEPCAWFHANPDVCSAPDCVASFEAAHAHDDEPIDDDDDIVVGEPGEDDQDLWDAPAEGEGDELEEAVG